MRKDHQTVLDSIIEELESEAFQKMSSMSEKHFTRQRVWTFTKVIILQLFRISKSMGVEIYCFLNRWYTGESSSKQALSQARKKIKWEGYEHLNNKFVETYYKEVSYKKYKGYMVVATDGSSYQVPSSADTIKGFGVFQKGISMVGGVKLYDPLNQIQLAASFKGQGSDQGEYASEESLFNESLEKFLKLIDVNKEQVVIVGDANYPSYYYFHELPRKGLSYLFRCSSSFCQEIKEFRQREEMDEELTIDLTKRSRMRATSAKNIENPPKSIVVRCVKIILPNGEIEYLLTNIGKETFSKEDLAELYWKRWGIETVFDIDKNKMRVENFACKTTNGVLQELYAAILTCNIAELLIAEAQEKIDKEALGNKKYKEYKINKSISLGLVRESLPAFLNKQIPMKDWFNALVDQLIRHKIPVRKGRTFQRKRRNQLKYTMCKRPPF